MTGGRGAPRRADGSPRRCGSPSGLAYAPARSVRRSSYRPVLHPPTPTVSGPNNGVPPTPRPPATTPGPASDARPWKVLSNPIDPRQQTALAFGQRSHWLQPWRGYLDTMPASRLRDAIGINFNVSGSEARATANLLAQSGFRRARIEIGWSEMSYTDPTQLKDPDAVKARIEALVDSGIRPMILLNANHAVPGPVDFFDAEVDASAVQGAQELVLDPQTAARVVPGRTGLNALIGGEKAADVIFTSVSDAGVARLSKPLPRDLSPGTYEAATLRFAPFAAPQTSGGEPNPSFERTTGGWLDYVSAVTRAARDEVGSDEFDVEVWNELSFGSDFLFAERYYSPVPSELSGRGEVTGTLLARTIAWLRDPSHDVSRVGIGNGFANQTPFAAGSNSPAGLTAIDKHPYHAGFKAFPRDSKVDGTRPVDALGQPDGESDGSGRWRETFTPDYRSFFPEYYLSGIQTEHMVRDLSPLTTPLYSTSHGRDTKGDGATKAPEMWITETNIDPAGAGGLTAADKRHLQAKATLRTIASWVNKGATAIAFYAVRDNDFSMVDANDPEGGETLTSVGRLSSAFAGPETISRPRRLELRQIADQHDHTQFSGDGTAAHPPLYNRDVLGFFPFQVDEDTFVAPVYVMTRDMARLYRPDAPNSDVTRYDLPPETYRLTIGGIEGADPRVSLRDPLIDDDAPVKVVSRQGDDLTVELEAADSPRLLKISDAGCLSSYRWTDMEALVRALRAR